jgi:hypothetical protein
MCRNFSICEIGGAMRVLFLGKDPGSAEGDSPTLYATDRTDRKTYIAQGWVVTDPQALAEIGPIPEGEAIIEIPEDVLKFYQHDQEVDR